MSKKYYKENKKEIREKQRIYNQSNKEEIKKRHKKYYETHKKEISEKRKKNYNDNKEEFKIKRRASDKKYYKNHREEISKKDKEYNRKNKKRISELNRIKYQKNKVKIDDRNNKYRSTHKLETSLRNKNNLLKLKTEVLTHYGNGKCECVKCGYGNIGALTIDHLNGLGNYYREMNNIGTGKKFYNWLKKNNYPSGFQTLCFNCQLIKCKEEKEQKKALSLRANAKDGESCPR